MKKHLFYTFLVIFIATAIVTLLGITGIIDIKEGYLTPLVAAFLIELGGAVIAIFKGTNFFEKEQDEISAEEDIRESIRKLDWAFGHVDDRLKDFMVIIQSDLLSAKHLGKTPRTDLMVAMNIVENFIGQVHPKSIETLLSTIADVLETGVNIGSSEKTHIINIVTSLPDDFAGIKARLNEIIQRNNG